MEAKEMDKDVDISDIKYLVAGPSHLPISYSLPLLSPSSAIPSTPIPFIIIVFYSVLYL